MDSEKSLMMFLIFVGFIAFFVSCYFNINLDTEYKEVDCLNDFIDKTIITGGEQFCYREICSSEECKIDKGISIILSISAGFCLIALIHIYFKKLDEQLDIN
jgi:hypothetical protein